MSYSVVLIRHGESEWTKKNLFCGWYDAGLTEKGISEGTAAGNRLKDTGLKFDVAFTSQLSRAYTTLDLVLKEIGQTDIPIIRSWKLNERHYGALTGLNKQQAAEKYGFDQIHIWRRSYDVFPPPMTESHEYYEDIQRQIRSLNNSECITIPQVETLKTTAERVVPYWLENIVPEIRSQKQVLVVSHGTCLRSLVKHIDDISDEEIMNINIPQAIPFTYQLDCNMRPLSPKKFLGDDETVQKAINKAASIANKD